MGKKMKVLEVLDTFYPNVDGPVNAIVNIAKSLNNSGKAEVELMVPDYPEERVVVENVVIHRAPFLPGPEGYNAAIPWLTGKVRKLLKEGQYDIIHAHSPFTLGKYVIDWAKILKIPSILTIHTKYKDDFERILKLKLFQDFMMNYIKGVINKADYVTSVSNGAAEVVKSYGYKGTNIEVIRNGTDLVPRKISADKISEIKREYNLENYFVFLFVGRLVSVKNVQFSLDVLAKIKKNGQKNFKFLIVGSGEYLGELKAKTDELGLADNVVFTGKILDRDKLAAIYSCADLFLFPSDFDTCGIVVIEAASFKLPCAVLKDSCPAERIVDNKNGLIINQSVDDWAEKISSFMPKRAELAKMGENALETLYVSWEKIAEEYLAFYKKIFTERETSLKNKSRKAQRKISKSAKLRIKKIKKAETKKIKRNKVNKKRVKKK